MKQLLPGLQILTRHVLRNPLHVTPRTLKLVLIHVTLRHYRSRLSVLGIRKDDRQGRRRSEYPLPYELLVLQEVALWPVNVTLQKHKPTLDVPLVKQLFHQQQDLVESQLVSPNFTSLLALKQLRVEPIEKVVSGHFHCQENHRLSQPLPDFLVLALQLKVLQSLVHHDEHLPLHVRFYLDRVHAPENRPITQVQKNSDELCILLGLQNLESFRNVLLTEQNMGKFIRILQFFLHLAGTYHRIQVSSTQLDSEIIPILGIQRRLLNSDRDDLSRKLLHEPVQKLFNLRHLRPHWSLKLLQSFQIEFHLCEWKLIFHRVKQSVFFPFARLKVLFLSAIDFM